MTPLPPSPPPPAPPPRAAGWPASTGGAMPRPSGPAPGLRYADPGPRLVAFIVDAVIIALLYIALFLALGLLAAAVAVASPPAALGVLVLFPLLILGLGLAQGAYFALFWHRSGATPGMRMVGVRVVRAADGGSLTGQQAILRAIGYWVSSAVMYLGFLWILIDDRRQGWHDKIADTVVIESGGA